MRVKMNNDKGFSIIELIIVIAIMAVLVGVIAPQFVKYIGRAKRVIDINNAAEYAQAANRSHVFNQIDSFDGAAELGNGMQYVAWGKDAIPYINLDSPSTFLDYFCSELGTVPISKTDENLYWIIVFDPTSMQLQSVSLMPEPTGAITEESVENDFYELWPDGSEFLENGIE